MKKLIVLLLLLPIMVGAQSVYIYTPKSVDTLSYNGTQWELRCPGNVYTYTYLNDAVYDAVFFDGDNSFWITFEGELIADVIKPFFPKEQTYNISMRGYPPLGLISKEAVVMTVSNYLTAKIY